jgi:chromosome segregation ATPase
MYMPSIEERLQALEQEHTQLKKTIELQTIAIGALVNKATLEKLNEKYDKMFDILMAHDRLTNERLGDIQGQLIEQDGKIVGLQTEMRQRFTEQDSKISGLDSKVSGLDSKVSGLQTEIRQRFNETDQRFTTLENTLAQILARLPENPPQSK